MGFSPGKAATSPDFPSFVVGLTILCPRPRRVTDFESRPSSGLWDGFPFHILCHAFPPLHYNEWLLPMHFPYWHGLSKIGDGIVNSLIELIFILSFLFLSFFPLPTFFLNLVCTLPSFRPFFSSNRYMYGTRPHNIDDQDSEIDPRLRRIASTYHHHVPGDLGSS